MVKTTQDIVPIEEIKNGFVKLKSGSICGVLLASSLNFALKSEDEQAAIIAQFQSFLNGLEFETQIFIQSREFDIRPYIALLDDRQKAQTFDLMKIQVREYSQFIKGYLDTHNVMSKSFFIVVPYNLSILKSKGGVGGLLSYIPGVGSKNTNQPTKQFEEAKIQLEQRMAVVQDGLSRTGIRVVALGTEELIELFYKIFNPGEPGKPMSTGDLK